MAEAAGAGSRQAPDLFGIAVVTVHACFRQCAILTSARNLALMGTTLANDSVNPITGERAPKSMYVPEVLSVMATGLMMKLLATVSQVAMQRLAQAKQGDSHSHRMSLSTGTAALIQFRFRPGSRAIHRPRPRIPATHAERAPDLRVAGRRIRRPFRFSRVRPGGEP